MDVLTAIKERRSVKHFDPEHVMSESEKEKLFSHALLSPTAFNIQHWRFVAVDDPAILGQIKEAAWGQAQVTDSSLFLVLCADKKAWTKNPGRYWVNAPKETQDYLLPTIKNYYEGKERVQLDECMRSCGIVAQTLMLAAKDMAVRKKYRGEVFPWKYAHIPSRTKNKATLVSKAARENCKCQGEMVNNRAAIKLNWCECFCWEKRWRQTR